jgi:hypothetical protein
MVALASPDKNWLTTEEAAAIAGCTEGWLRLLLGKGDKRLEGWKVGERAWLVSRTSVESFKGSLTSRSVGKRQATKKVAKRKKSR